MVAESPSGSVADERHKAAFGFLQLAAQAGHPVPVADYPTLLAEIDALIAEHKT